MFIALTLMQWLPAFGSLAPCNVANALFDVDLVQGSLSWVTLAFPKAVQLPHLASMAKKAAKKAAAEAPKAMKAKKA